MINETICSKYYSFVLSEDVISIERIPRAKKEKVSSFICLFLFAGIMFFVSIYVMLSGAVGYAIASLSSVLLIVIVSVSSEYKLTKQEAAKYNFTMNGRGVCHSAMDKDYLLRWDEICFWGCSNNNFMDRVGRPSTKQMCIYFSKRVYCEKELKKSLKFIESKKQMHGSTEEIIIFGFRENTVDEALYNRIVQFISERCNIEPTNYIEQVTDF